MGDEGTGKETGSRRKPPAFQFYVREYETDEAVKLMTLEEEGAYVRLMCNQWNEGSIPKDLALLARIWRVSLARAKKIWAAIAPKFVPHPSLKGRLVNLRLAEQREEYEQFIARSRLGGQRSAQRRWGFGDKQNVSTLTPPLTDGLQANGNTASVTASATEQLTDEQISPSPRGLNDATKNRASRTDQSKRRRRTFGADD